ncbi:uncharacterized protein L201_005517 [Kwoniella dendrophila CBS 6074]|uniref:Uncharacterized protein n=1 Tax=Kwoniella dendrophila CBS 6074 TaxID=1295534 RepID=A0AAX4JYL9_9TREE
METPPPTEPLYHQPATPTTFQSTPYTTPGSSLPQTPFSSNAAPGPSSSRRAPGGFGPIIDAEDDEEPITTGYASSGTRYSPPQKPEGYVAVPKRRKWTNIQEIFALGPNIQPDPFGSHSFGGPLDIKEISNPLSDEYCGANVLLTSMHKDTSTTVTAYPYAPQGGGHPGCCAI